MDVVSAQWLDLRLQALSERLEMYGVTGAALEGCQGLMEALRASAGEHQVYESTPRSCASCGQYWPCRVVRDVAAGLEELL